ncbi:hypothetical protein L3Q82_020021 [Scortum barcoo]|uniref:Uncharacterized protein n=1 Tax=Scortum barcoo TaxID=214431 RepID=A0ACB8VD06_9TELE|nr:hypothetical protein L3Q82_020021 [Scortum barcoo]
MLASRILFDQDPKLRVKGYSTWLKCESSCRLPDRTSFVWYKNGQKIQKQTLYDYHYYHLEDFHLADSYSCAAQGYEDFPSPSVCVDGQTCNRVTYTDRSICASKGSSVDISCTYNSDENDVESKFWFRTERSRRWQNPSQPEDLSKDSQYAGRVQVLETERGRSTLRIRDLRERDSAQYHFTFKTPSFEWRSSLPATTLTVTGVDGQNCNRVTYTDRSICAFKGSSVDISCTYNSYEDDVESKFWFSPERSRRWQNPSQPEDLSKDSQYAGRVQVP